MLPIVESWKTAIMRTISDFGRIEGSDSYLSTRFINYILQRYHFLNLPKQNFFSKFRINTVIKNAIAVEMIALL